MYVCLEDKGEINNVVRFTRDFNYNCEGLFMLLRKTFLKQLCSNVNLLIGLSSVAFLCKITNNVKVCKMFFFLLY